MIVSTLSICAEASAMPNWRWPFRLPFRLLNPNAERSQPKPEFEELAGLKWHTDYHKAWSAAKAEKKLLLILFTANQQTSYRKSVVDLIGRDKKVAEQLSKDYVIARLSTNYCIKVKGRNQELLRHGSMGEMHGREGLAIVDLKNEKTEHYGHVVSAFPFSSGKYYHFQASYLPTILNLPAGTITQRTMVWAVRIHPEAPASTFGQASHTLRQEARSHSEHQAAIGIQGHHQWESRFHRILGRLGGRHAPVEVVAESWPDQTMIDSCIDCVASWRQSSGHWNTVKSHQTIYGYDIKRGSNGIWYGTGIFAQ
jgi:hypothetical protein